MSNTKMVVSIWPSMHHHMVTVVGDEGWCDLKKHFHFVRMRKTEVRTINGHCHVLKTVWV